MEKKIIAMKRLLILVTITVLCGILLTNCNFPKKNADQTQAPDLSKDNTPIVNITNSTSTPTQEPSLCDNLYQPSIKGDTWVYSGTNTAMSSYNRTDTIINSTQDSYTTQSTLSGVTYTVDYECTREGLVAQNPIQQYLGALLAAPNSPISVNLISASGISLPKQIKPGDTWQQNAEVDTKISGTSMNGIIVFNYTAAGIESVTVAAGTFNAMRVNATIRIEVTPLRILAGTITSTSWYAPGVGIIKTESTSNVPGVNFTDHTELSSFTPAS